MLRQTANRVAFAGIVEQTMVDMIVGQCRRGQRQSWCAIAVAAVAAVGCTTSRDPGVSSSATNFLRCSDDADCAGHAGAVRCDERGYCVDQAGKRIPASAAQSDAGAPHPVLTGGDASTGELRVGDACRGRELPSRSRPAPQVVSPSSELLPDGAVRPIDAGAGSVDNYVPPSTPVCLTEGEAAGGYFSWTCESDHDCPDGSYCDLHESPAPPPRAYCRTACSSDADCGGRLCCGESTPLTCVEQDGVRGCRCDVLCRPVYPFDGGSVHYEPSTCGNCDFWCCDTACLNLANDDRNCGSCGNVCEGDFPFCDQGRCGVPPGPAPSDAGAPACERACGSECCASDERCCAVPGPGGGANVCHPVDQPCPMGCLTCMCASPDTPVETPHGERAIGELSPGDLVFSLEGSERVIVPLLRVNRTPVPPEHAMVRVLLAGGRSIAMSPGHPTADGRSFGDLAPGDRLGALEVLSVQTVPYGHSFTVDILPASSTGAYFAADALVGSTLAPSAASE